MWMDYNPLPARRNDLSLFITVHLWLNVPMAIHLLNCFTCNARFSREWYDFAAMWILLLGPIALLIGLPRTNSLQQ